MFYKNKAYRHKKLDVEMEIKSLGKIYPMSQPIWMENFLDPKQDMNIMDARAHPMGCYGDLRLLPRVAFRKSLFVV